jgi:hypothetical protein
MTNFFLHGQIYISFQVINFIFITTSIFIFNSYIIIFFWQPIQKKIRDSATGDYYSLPPTNFQTNGTSYLLQYS